MPSISILHIKVIGLIYLQKFYCEYHKNVIINKLKVRLSNIPHQSLIKFKHNILKENESNPAQHRKFE